MSYVSRTDIADPPSYLRLAQDLQFAGHPAKADD